MNEAGLRRNVRLYGWFKIFTKRVFLPLIAIYLVEVGHVTIGGIGVIAVVSSLIGLAVQMPSAYLADRYTRRSVMMIGSALLVIGTGLLVFMPSFVGGLLAGILTNVGYSFISGAEQALMHDSLEQSGHGDDYVKVMGRAQSQGLVGNVVLVGLIPMTYALDKRLPFVLGVLAFLLLLGLSWAFVEPKRHDKPDDDGRYLNAIVLATRTFVNRQTVVLFLAMALVFGLYVGPSDYNMLVIKDLGLSPQYIGWIFAGASLLGAAGGYVIHFVQKLSFKAYLYLDVFVCCGFSAVVGLARNLTVTLVALLLTLGFWRLRGILYQYYLLDMFRGTRHKAMLVSLLNFGEQLFSMLFPVLFLVCIAHWGYYVAYAAIGVIAAVVLWSLSALGFVVLNRVPLKKATQTA